MMAKGFFLKKSLAIAIVLLTAAVGSASAYCVCNDGWCDNVGRAYYQCGDTVTESCTFNGSMTCTDTTKPGLKVGADNIVIDGAGYKITGNENANACRAGCVEGEDTSQTIPAMHSGILIKYYDNVTVKNLEIENFCSGIALKAKSSKPGKHTVTGCKIHDNGNDTAVIITHGIHMVYTNWCNITKNDIYNNTGGGCGCDSGGNGIFLFGDRASATGYYNNITCNNLSYNNKSGFFTKHQCRYTTISHNNVIGNGVGGITLRCMATADSIIEYNNVSNNYGTGIYIRGHRNIVRYNTVINNKNGSWAATGCSPGDPAYAVGHNGVGIRVQSDAGAGNQIYNNTVCDNDARDIEDNSGRLLSGDSNTCFKCSGYNDTSAPAGQCCVYTCDNLVPTYYDFDGDGHYSKDPADCSCGNTLGVGSCCNPGLFNSSHAENLKAAGICVLSSDTHDDVNDCDPSITAVKPDLVIRDKSEEWINDTHFKVHYKVCNIGEGDAGANAATLYVDGAEVEHQATPALDAGACTGEMTFTTEVECPCGDEVNITVCADNGNVIDESDETNNCMVNIVECKPCPKPDLVIEKTATWSDGTLTVNYNITNQGGGNAGASTMCVYVNGVRIADCNKTVPALDAGASVTGTTSCSVECPCSTSINVTACADCENAVDESNEANNCEVNMVECPVCAGGVIKVVPEEKTVQPQDQFKVDIKLTPGPTGVYGIQYKLHYNTSVIRAETQVSGDFFGDNDTLVALNKIDHAKGEVLYAETLTGDACIRDEGTVATIQFTAIGEPGATSTLNFSDVISIDCNKTEVYPATENGTVKIYKNHAPEIICAASKHERNNAAKKYACNALLCVNVTDHDTFKGYNIAYIRWDFGDGQYGTSEGGLPCNASDGYCCLCKEHAYISWNYNASGRDLNGHTVYYDPFNASVTVTDDGCPELTDTKCFDVWVFIAGDANGDGKVNIMDLVWVGKHFNEKCEDHSGGTECCDYKWDNYQRSGADLNNDCRINIADAVLVGANWGHTAW